MVEVGNTLACKLNVLLLIMTNGNMSCPRDHELLR